MNRIPLLLSLLLNGLAAWAQPSPAATYALKVQANLAQPRLAVSGSVAFAAAKAARDSVTLLLHRTMGKPRLQLLAPAGTAFRVDERPGDDGQVAYILRFARPLPAQAAVKIGFDYSGGQQQGPQFLLDTAFCMAGGYGAAWYPQVQTYQPDKTSNTLEGRGTVDVLTTGRFLPVMPGGLVQTSRRKGTTSTRFTFDQPAIFSLFIGRYLRSDYGGAIPMTAYRLRADTATAGYLRRSARVLAGLSSTFGPYPFRNFSLIEFPDAVSARLNVGGSSEHAVIVMPSSALTRPFNYALFGHELSHQWWGNLITTRGTRGTAMMTEAMAQFGSLQAVKMFDSAHAEAYRRTGYPGYIPDQSGLGYLKLVTAGTDAPLAELNDKNAHSLGDSKGFLVLELLSETIGPARMQKALQTITRQYAGRPLTWEDFLAEIQQAAGQDLGWFYQQWFEQTGAPAWELAWKKAGPQLELSITQPAPAYRLSPDLLVRGTRGETLEQTVAIAGPATTLRVPIGFDVKSVELDPHFKILHWTPASRQQARDLLRVSRVMQLRMQGKAEEAIRQGEQELAELSRAGQPDPYAVEFSICYQLGRLKGIQARPDEALAYYQRAIKCSARDTSLLAYTYYRIAELAYAKHDQALLSWAKANAINADLLAGKPDDMEKLCSALR